MSRRWLTSNGATVIEHTSAKVAIGGVVKRIQVASVVDQGIVRQFWPYLAPTTDPRIALTTAQVDISRRQIDPDDSLAQLNVNRLLGFATYANFPQADGNFPCINPGLDGTGADNGKYLIRVDQTGGTALTGTLATWIDINSLADHVWSLDQTVVGALAATANLSISQDDGGGNPVAATTVVKPLTFASEVLATTDITWTTVQHDLVEIKESVDADCVLTFNPSGSADGSADTSGSFTENWQIDAPVVPNPELYTVNVALVSGTAPTGSLLATDLTLDQVRQWTLLATDGEDLSCALDVTVDNLTPLGNLVTKRITMNSQRNANESANVWTTDAWFIEDSKTGAPNTVSCTVDLGIDGIGIGSNSVVSNIINENWNSGAPTPPDPANYECFATRVSGAATQSGDVLDQWLSLSQARSWTYTSTNIGTLNPVLDVSVRRVGEPTVTKRVNMLLAIEL